MNSVNLTASVSNLTQVDRLQHDVHRTPVVNQDQNAAIALQEAQRRINMPVPPDQAEGKNVDPDDRRRQTRERKRKRDRAPAPRSPSADHSSGHFVDLDA